MANCDSEFFGLVFSRVSGHPKNSRPKFTSRIVGIPLQFHILEPKIYSRRFKFLLAGETKKQSMHEGLVPRDSPNLGAPTSCHAWLSRVDWLVARMDKIFQAGRA